MVEVSILTMVICVFLFGISGADGGCFLSLVSKIVLYTNVNGLLSQKKVNGLLSKKKMLMVMLGFALCN